MDPDSVDQLSELQRSCLRLVAQGLTSKEIGRELDISPNYVDHQMRAAIRTLRVRDRGQAADILLRSIDGQSDGQPPSVEPDPQPPIPDEQPSTGRRWPIPTKGRALNDLSAVERLVWALAIAVAAILIGAFVIDSLERLGRMV